MRKLISALTVLFGLIAFSPASIGDPIYQSQTRL
jgi:hypothetical protein